MDEEEITLADLVNTIWRRKIVLGVVFLLCSTGAVAYTAFAEREYEAEATLVPLKDPDIIRNYLESRSASTQVGENLGDSLLSELFPQLWGGSGWKDMPPTEEEIGTAIRKLVSVRSEQVSEYDVRAERKITITVAYGDPQLAKDIANEFLHVLQNLRPVLEDREREEKFDQYHNGNNFQQAQGQAEAAAKNKEYWLVLDTARTPVEPSSPNVTLNIALGVVLGLMLGLFSVFAVEWLSGYRAERRKLIGER